MVLSFHRLQRTISLGNSNNIRLLGIKPEIIDLKYLYVEVDSSVYYNSNAISDATELVTSVTKETTSYSQSSDINVFWW